jgi:hypothetical protein
MQDTWMTPHAAVLVDPPPGWASTLAGSLNPGAHVFVVTDELVGIEGRIAGFELRDTVLILSAGPRSRYAFLFRKPTAETTVLSQLVETRAGALNIAACRIGTGKSIPGSVGEKSGLGGFGTRPGRAGKAETDSGHDPNIGRWPTNILFVHGEECLRRGTMRVPSSQPRTRTKAAGFHPENRVFGTGKGEFFSIGYGDDEGLETIANWDCAASCSVRVLDGLSGQRPATLTGRADPRAVHANPGDNNGTSLFGGGNSNVYADHGGASRYYPQFANDDEMLAWMKNLIEVPQHEQL